MSKSSRVKNQQKPVKYSQPKDRFGLWVGLSITIIGIIITTIVIITTVTMNNQTQVDASTTSPQGVVNDGFVINNAGLVISDPEPVEQEFTESEYTDTTNNLNMFIDYSCSYCANFDKANFEQIQTWLEDGTLDTVTIHPLAFLTQYSETASNAFSCTAEYAPERMLDAHEILTANYTNALSSQQIITAFEDEGFAFTDDYVKCVRGGKYVNFVLESTTRAQSGPIPASTNVERISGTPTILINGQRYNGNPTDATEFATFVNSNLQPAAN